MLFGTDNNTESNTENNNDSRDTEYKTMRMELLKWKTRITSITQNNHATPADLNKFSDFHALGVSLLEIVDLLEERYAIDIESYKSVILRGFKLMGLFVDYSSSPRVPHAGACPTIQTTIRRLSQSPKGVSQSLFKYDINTKNLQNTVGTFPRSVRSNNYNPTMTVKLASGTSYSVKTEQTAENVTLVVFYSQNQN